MADFSALKTAIQANIRTNANEEITGAILQDILLSMVTTMGDVAINALAEALQAEITNRQNDVSGEATTRAEADSELSGRINAEAQTRGEADTQLSNRITAITTRLNEGYVYAGIATPSTNPGTPAGKVFYIALQAGTYTNFSSLTVTQGINILKYNGTAWSQEQLVGIDDVPTKESNKLVKSGGVFANMGAFDISDYHKSGSTLATYADLTAALAALPSDFQKGGMSIKFVQSSDNKYVQYLLTKNTWSASKGDWEKMNLEDEVSQLDQKVDVNNKDYQDISSLVINGNAGYIRAANGSIAPGTTYPNSRYTNPIHLYPGDVVYIKANIESTSIAAFTECDSSGENRKVITPGVEGVSEFRYVATKETYIILSIYNVANVSSGLWKKLSNNTASVLCNTAMVFHGQLEKLGNNIWATNPTGNPANLENLQNNMTITRRMVYSCIRWAQFTGLDKTIKRTIYILWNGYADKFRVAISKYDTDAAQWVVEFDTSNIEINTINPNHNAVIPVSIGNNVKLLVDTSLFGYWTYSTIINPLGTDEPEFIFSDACYQESPNVVVDALKTTTPKIYPNALLPCISFEFDDNGLNDDLVVDLFDELGLRCNFAFIASEEKISNYGDKYLDWHRRGYGICSHSVDSTIFNTTNYTAETALAALQTSKNRLQNKGFVVNGFVAPSSQMADEFLDLVKETYGYGFTSNDGYSGQRKGNPCRQSRQSMESATLSYVKGRIDVAIAFGYNFTFYGHSANFGTTYSGEEWNIAKLRAILEYAIAKRDAGQLFIGNTDECMDYFYGGNLYNEHLSGNCGTIQPKNRYHYYLHNVTSATIAYSANLPAECEIMLETDASYTSGITFGSGYKFASVPTFGAGETWYIKIVQGCVIATKMI